MLVEQRGCHNAELTLLRAFADLVRALGQKDMHAAIWWCVRHLAKLIHGKCLFCLTCFL